VASQAKPWVLVAPNAGGLKGRRESSIPHVAFVVVDFVTFQEPSELILETQNLMMFGLRANVFPDFSHR